MYFSRMQDQAAVQRTAQVLGDMIYQEDAKGSDLEVSCLQKPTAFEQLHKNSFQNPCKEDASCKSLYS